MTAFGDQLTLWSNRGERQCSSGLPYGGRALCLRFSPSGDSVVVGCMDGTAMVFGISTKPDFEDQNKNSKSSKLLSPRFMVDQGTTPHSYIMFKQTILRGHRDFVSCCSWSDTNTILTGSNDGTLRLWDVSSGRCLRTLRGHSGGILCCDFDPSGKTIISGSGAGDYSTKLWGL